MASVQSCQSELLPMQANKREDFVVPVDAPMFQYARLDIPPPKDYFLWSICCFVYANPCCLGLAALYFSIKARDRKMLNDLESARDYGSTARCLNIISLVLIVIGVIVVIIIISVLWTTIEQMRQNQSWPPMINRFGSN